MDHGNMLHTQWNTSYIVLSYVIAALASYVSLELAGLGIVVMHYTGMAAYQLPGTEAQIVWFPLVASILIAVGASAVAFYLFRLLSSSWAERQSRLTLTGVKIGAGLVMGGAVIGMHYTGMAALQYRVVDELKVGLAASGVDTSLLALLVGVVSFLLIGLAVTSLLMDAGRSVDSGEMDFTSAAD